LYTAPPATALLPVKVTSPPAKVISLLPLLILYIAPPPPEALALLAVKTTLALVNFIVA
jgi:hypothetical protein